MTPLPPAAGGTAGLWPEPDPSRLSRREGIPFVLALVPLLALVVSALLIHQTSIRLRSEVREVIDPARGAVEEIHSSLAREVAFLRGFLLTGDPDYLERYREALAREQGAHRRFAAILGRLDPQAGSRYNQLRLAEGRWHDHLAATGILAPGAVLRTFEEIALDQALFDDALGATDHVERTLDALAARRWDRVVAIEHIDVAATGLLSLLVLAAVVAMLRGHRRTDHLAAVLGRRAAEEAAFRRLAREVAAAPDTREVAERVVHGAWTLTESAGALMEWILPGGAEVEIAAAAGDCTLDVGIRSPYRGSITARVFESGQPTLGLRLTEIPGAAWDRLRARCADYAVLAAPLVGNGEPIGALVLLRAPRQPPFAPERAARFRIVSDFAELALRRARLIEEAERRRHEIEVSEQRYRSLFTNNPSATFEADLAGRVITANPAAARIIGYENHEMVGMEWWQFVDPEDIDLAAQHLGRAAAGEPQTADLRLVRKDRRRIDAHLVAVPVVVRGEIVGIFGAGEDVTERKRAEAELRRLTAILEATPDFVGIADDAGGTLYVNRAGRRLLDIPEGEDLTGAPIATFASARARETLHSQVLMTAAREGSWSGESGIIARDGREIPVSKVVIAHRDDEGRVEYFSTIMRDITERKRAESQREVLLAREQAARTEAERRRGEVERLMRSKARLIRGFSHDLKNPIGAIAGYAEILEAGIKGELTAAQRESVGRIREATRSILELIDQLVDLAKAETGALKLELESVDLAGLVAATVEEYRADAETRRLDLALEPAEPLPAVRTDPSRVRQILGNLLSNAIKFTPPGGRIRVRLRTRDGGEAPGHGRWICVDVSDTGPGIPPDQQERIFEEFSRLRPEATRGTGLGLAISRRLARALGGDLTVASEHGRESTFTLRLPLRPADAERAAEPAPPETGA